MSSFETIPNVEILKFNYEPYRRYRAGAKTQKTRYAYFAVGVSESGAISAAKTHFDTCSEPYCKPKLVIHFGENRPTFHGLEQLGEL